MASPSARRMRPISPGPGSRRWRATTSISIRFCSDTAPSEAAVPPVASKRWVPSRTKASWSPSSSPSSSQITSIGTWDETCAARSAGEPAAASSSSRRATIASTLGSSLRQPGPGELRGDELAQPGVHRRIGEAQPADVRGRAGAGVAEQVPHVVAVGVAVGEDGAGLFVPGHQVDREPERQVEPLHGASPAQFGELGHRVRAVAQQGQPRALRQERQLGEVEALPADPPLHQPAQPRRGPGAGAAPS